MKKVIIILLTIAALAIAGVFIFIPSKIKVSSATVVLANELASHRILMDEANWAKWWPNEKVFQLDKTSFKLTQKMLNGFELEISGKGEPVASQLMILPMASDSIKLSWSCDIESGNDPLKRISGYNRASVIKKDLDKLLQSLAKFLSDQRNIYGFEIKEMKVTDSVLVSTRKTFDHYPDEFQTEEMIQKLRRYIKKNNAKEMSYPMLHIREVDSLHFEAMTAIATDIKLPDNNEFASKMVLKGGNLLEAPVTGGHATIRKGFIEYENAMKEYSWTSPAIPYQLIITDRIKERDTTRWVTILCYPVF
ncbi:MAG: hypothetical protein E6H07_04140 [Bacteroidetes bacterium]|nr:MAG: hypothetical protein E6H07_04140 [Bacteroidota bacterium]